MSDSDHRTTNENEDDNEEPVAPDGGWGWVVVAASFLIHVIADGIVYSFGIYYIEFLDYYHGGRGETAWIGSLVPGITYSVGPLASALTNKYGCRSVTIAGSIIATTGFFISYFAPNLGFLYFSIGITSGLGFGLIYLPAIVSVTQYFEKKRAFATGLAVCGSGVGTFIFAPLTKWLIDSYTWKGAILIEAGLIFNCVICGALFRPLFNKHSSESGDSSKSGDSERKALVTNDEKRTMPNNETKTLWKLDNPLLPSNMARNNSIVQSDGALHLIGNGNKPLPKQLMNLRTEALRIPPQHVRRSHSNLLMNRKDVFYSGSLYNIPMYKSNPALYITSITSIPSIADTSDTKTCQISPCIKFSPEVQGAFDEMLDLGLLKDPVFLLFAISNFCTSIGFNMPFIYLPDRAIELGIDKGQGAFLVSIIGIANTAGRIIFGWLADKPYVNRLMLYNTALVICGIATALSPLCRTYPLLIVYAILFGVFIGVYVSLTSVVLVDLLGIEKLTNSFGLLLLFQGMATLIGPPIAGWLCDGTGSYDLSFIVEGVTIAVSGAILYLIPCLQRHLDRKRGVSKRDIDFGRQISIEISRQVSREIPTIVYTEDFDDDVLPIRTDDYDVDNVDNECMFQDLAKSV